MKFELIVTPHPTGYERMLMSKKQRNKRRNACKHQRRNFERRKVREKPPVKNWSKGRIEQIKG